MTLQNGVGNIETLPAPDTGLATAEHTHANRFTTMVASPAELSSGVAFTVLG